MKLQKRNWLIAAGALVWSAGASAQVTNPSVPAECSDSRDSRGWTASRQAGDSRIQAVWKSAAVKKNLDNLSDQLPTLLDALQATMTGLVGNEAVTQYTRCRAQGYADGFFYRLNVLFGQCVLDGADWAQFAANLYCTLSTDLGGLAETSLFVRAPVGMCGNLFEATCEDVYRYVGLEGDYALNPAIASYLEHNDFTPEAFPGCKAFAQDEFLAVFEASLHNDCSYEIAE